MKAGVEPARRPRPVARCGPSARPARRCRPRASAGSTSTSARTPGCSPPRGGTDLCTAFVGGAPLRAGLRGRAAGARARRRDRVLGPGRASPLIGEVGELVLTEPMPSMPIYFWDDDGRRALPRGLLRHLPRRLAPRRLDRDHRPRHRDHHAAAPTRRSTAAASAWARPRSTARCWPSTTIIDALVVDVPVEGEDAWMPLFVVLREGAALTDEVVGRDPHARARGLLAAPRAERGHRGRRRSRARCRARCSSCRSSGS